MDIVSPDTRHRMMSSIRARNTKPEVVFRKGLHRRGYRYRLNAPHLPGKPDFILPRYRVAAFVHGCFWHRHDCYQFKMPSTRTEFWDAKLNRNQTRDAEVMAQIIALQWRHLTVWECSMRGRYKLGLDCALDQAEQWLLTSVSKLEIRGLA